MPSVSLNFLCLPGCPALTTQLPARLGFCASLGPGWKGWLLGGGLGCGAHSEALLQGLEQHLLEASLLVSLNAGCRVGGWGEKLICGCLQQLAVVGKGVSETQKKRKGALQPVFCSPLANTGPHTVFSWASFFPQSPRLPAQGRAFSLLSWGTSNCSACRCMGRSSDTCLGWELGTWGCLSGTPMPRSSRGSHCSAGLVSSSAKVLKVQSQQQEQSHIKPLGDIWRNSLRCNGLDLIQKLLVSFPVSMGLSIAGFSPKYHRLAPL